MELKGKKINFLGDSITEGHCASTPDKCYIEILKQKYGLSEARNYGISGTRIARQQRTYMFPEFDRDFCSRVGDMDKDADIVIVFGGTNDHGHGDAPFGADADRTPDTFCGACHVLFSTLKERFPKSAIVVLTPLHRSDDNVPKPGSGKLLRDYAGAIRTTAALYDLPVLDLFETSAIRANIPEIAAKYTEDGLHPNDAGHTVLADEIAAFIQKL